MRYLLKHRNLRYMDVSFYSIKNDKFVNTICNITAKAVQEFDKICLITSDLELQRQMNESLWTFSSLKFVPHFSMQDGELMRLFEMSDVSNNLKRVLIASQVAQECGNNDCLVFCSPQVDGIEELLKMEKVRRICICFDSISHDNDARLLWIRLKSMSVNFSYWYQDEQDKWVKK